MNYIMYKKKLQKDAIYHENVKLNTKHKTFWYWYPQQISHLDAVGWRRNEFTTIPDCKTSNTRNKRKHHI